MDTDMDLRKLVEKLRMSRNYMVQTTIHDVLQNAQYDLDELQADIAETLDSYVGDNQDQFLTLGRKAGKGVVPDARWSSFDKDEDVKTAASVPTEVRAESLAHSTDLWRVRGNVPMGAEQQGYASSNAAGLEPRVQSLALSAGPDAWRARYQEAAATWVSEMYDVTVHNHSLSFSSLEVYLSVGRIEPNRITHNVIGCTDGKLETSRQTFSGCHNQGTG
eukprot:m.213834 g.213834  ORF g.213834 m.213834 type:complete len:219 (-) comp15865_c0_seq14:650-1306(-)